MIDRAPGKNLVLRSIAVVAGLMASSWASAQTADDNLPLRFGSPDLYNDVDNLGRVDQPDELEQASSSPGELSADDLSKELSNPNSPLASLTFKQVYTRFDGSLPGADDQSSNLTLFQPTFPFPLDDSGTTNLFIRPAIAYVWEQPAFDPGTGAFDSLSGWSDLGFDVAVGRSWDSGWVAVGGVQGTIPLYSDVSARQWRLGPELLAGYIGQRAFVVGFPSHQWNIAGDDYEFSTSQLELFAGVYLPNAWTVYTDSVFEYDWVTKQATLPLNLTVRKVLKVGNMPISVSLGVDHFFEANDRFGPHTRITLNVTPVVKNFILSAFQR